MIVLNQRVNPFPFSHASFFRKRITATLTCCLQPCGWDTSVRIISYARCEVKWVTQNSSHRQVGELLLEES